MRVQRDANLRVVDRLDVKLVDLRVLNAIFSFTTSFGVLADVVPVNRLAAVAFATEPLDVQRWQRARVHEAGRRLASWGVIEYRPKRGRPTNEDGGPRVELAVIDHAERHPLSKVLFGQEKHPGPGVVDSEKAPSSDEKSTLESQESHPPAPPGNSNNGEVPENYSIDEVDGGREKTRDEIRRILEREGCSDRAIDHTLHKLARSASNIGNPYAWALTTARRFDGDEKQSTEDKKLRVERQKAIDECGRCDPNGWISNGDGTASKCTHERSGERRSDDVAVGDVQ